MAKLGEYVNIKTGKLDANASSENGKYPFFTCAIEPLKIDTYSYDCECVLVAGNGDLNVKYYSGKFDAYQRTYIIESRDKSKLYVPYMYYFLDKYVETLRKLSIGGVIKYIKLGNLTDSEIPITELSIQKKIVFNLDKVTHTIDTCNAILEKLDLLVESPVIELFGDPVENPFQWDTIPLENACQSIVDCPHSTPSYTFENTGYMCIRTSIVKKNAILWDKIEYIPKDEYEQRIRRRKPQKGDIIYTREGAILGIAAIIDKDCNVALGQRSMLLSPDTEICLPEFISSAMNFDSFFNRVTEGVSGSASPHINVADIRAFGIMIPPIDLQEQFAAFVEQTDKSKLAVKQVLEKAETLKKALMQEYFGQEKL